MKRSKFLIINFFFVLLFLIPLILINQNYKKAPVQKPTQTPEPKENIIVYSPKANAEVTSKFKLTGITRTSESTFTFRLKDKKRNKVLGQSSSVSDSTDSGKFGNFNFELDFKGNADDLNDGDELILEVFQNFTEDGTEIEKVTIPLKFNGQEENLSD